MARGKGWVGGWGWVWRVADFIIIPSLICVLRSRENGGKGKAPGDAGVCGVYVRRPKGGFFVRSGAKSAVIDCFLGIHPGRLWIHIGAEVRENSSRARLATQEDRPRLR